MNDSQTAKRMVFLTGRVPEELKKRFDAERKRRGWNAQTALERVVYFWLEAGEMAAEPQRPKRQIIKAVDAHGSAVNISRRKREGVRD